jgi:uncharacterized protein YdaU (DUF1376 family)
MPADLTRFDFHVLRFMKSLDVMAMSAEEVGAYILLLSESWLIGDECTLPDDPELLARLARVKRVSERVMKKFPVVDTQWGMRRRNEVLFTEWLATVSRSDSARKSVETRWEYERNTNVSTSYIPKSNQTDSIQSKPNQDSGIFRNIRIRYRSFFNIGHSNAKQFKDKYAVRCNQFGEDAVLARFDEWANANIWRKDKLGNSGLRFFLADLPELMDENTEAAKLTEIRLGPIDFPVNSAAINESANAEVRTEVQKKLDEIESEKELYKDIPIDQF